MKRTIKRTLLITIVPTLALAVALFTVDFGFLRGPIERSMSEALGRDLSIDGDFSIRLGDSVVIVAHDLSVSNPESFGNEHFLSIQHLLLELETASLWQDGPLVIRQLAVSDAGLTLIENEDGQTNWVFGSSEPTPATPTRTALPVLLREAQLEQLAVELRSGRLEQPLHLHIDQFEQRLNSEGMAEALLQGRIESEPLAFDGFIGPWSRLHNGRDMQIAGSGTLGLGRFTVDARFDSLFEPNRPELTLTGHSPSLARLTRTLSLGEWGDGEVTLEIQTRVEGRQLLATVNAAIGPLTTNLEARTDSLQESRRLSLSGSAAGQNFGGIARLAGYPGWPQQPFKLEVDAHRDGNELNINRLDVALGKNAMTLSGRVPQLPLLVGAKLNLDIAGPQLNEFTEVVGAGPLPPVPFKVNGTVMDAANGQTGIDLDFQTEPISGWVRGQLADDRTYDLDLQVNGPDLASLKRLKGLTGLPSGPFSIDGDIIGSHTGSHLDLAFSAAPGKGHIKADILRDDRLKLDLDVGGALASRLGPIVGIPGLPDATWTLQLGLDRATDAVFDLRLFRFETDGMQVSAAGVIGAHSIHQGTDLDVTLAGEDMSRFQALVPPPVVLLAQSFKLGGRIASKEQAWLLDGLVGQFGPTRIEVSGPLSLAENFAGTRLSLASSGDNFGVMLDPPGELRLPAGPYSTRAVLAIDEARLRVEGFQLTSGPLNLNFDLELPWPMDAPGGQFSLQGQGRDITRILPRLAGLDLEALPYQARGQGTWTSELINIGDFEFSIGESELRLDGTIDLPPDTSGTRLDLAVRAPNLSRIGTVDGTRYGELPFELETRLEGNAEQMELTQLKARLGQSDIRATLRLDLAEQPPAFDLKLSTKTLDLRPIMEGKEPSATGKDGPKKKDRLIPDIPLDISRLGIANGSFAVAADELIGRRSRLYNNLISGRIQDGGLQINEIGVDTLGGRLIAGLDVTPEPGGATRLSASVHSKNLVLDFSNAPEEEKLREPRFNIDLDLVGSGFNLRELAASLQGAFAIHSPGGTVVNTNALDMKDHLLAQIVMAVSPSVSMRSEIEISCFAAVGTAKDGVIHLEPGLALQSDRINTFSNGTIDLASERLNLNIESRTRRLVAISAGELVSPFVKVGGTLANPSIGIDAKGTLLTGGAAVLSGGLSLLAEKALRQLDTRDPCGQILEAATPDKKEP